MPLRLNLGVSRKLGLPDYGSAGAMCNIELELDQALLERDPEGFRARVRAGYAAARAAVHDELARLRDHDPEADAESDDHNPHSHGRGPAPRRDAGTPAGDGRSARSGPPATPKQVGAIRALARRHGADLEGLLRDDHGVGRPEDLSRAQASTLIDQLRAADDA